MKTPINRLFAILALTLLTLTACNFTFGVSDDAPADTPEPTLPAETPASDFYVRITEPVPAGDEPVAISTQSVTVRGVQFGSFENNVIVEVHSSDSTVLAQTATTASGEMGTEGTWEVTLDINATPGTTGSIYAYFTSARDGSVVAEDRVPVQFVENAN